MSTRSLGGMRRGAWQAATRPLLLGLLCVGTAGCHLLLPFKSSGPPRFSCVTERWDCKAVAVAPSVKPLGAPGFESIIQKYEVQSFLWSEKDEAYKAYVDENVYVHQIAFDKLKGTLMIRPRRSDWSVKAQDFLRIEVNSPVQAVYVAYDSRANPKPSWLTGDYTQEKLANGTPARIWISVLDQSTGASGPPQWVSLEIWRKTTVPASPGPSQSAQIDIPGCQFPGPGGPAVQWPGVPESNRAMYLVFVEAPMQVDCVQPTKPPTSVQWEHCASDLNDAAAKALKDCQDQSSESQACKNPTCKMLEEYTEEGCANVLYGGALKQLDPLSFEPRSVIGFTPSKSVALIEVKGKKYQRGVNGKLYFDYVLDSFQTMRSLSLLSMQLEVDPLDTDVGRVENISIALRQPATADCTKENQYWGTPCDVYQVPQYEFYCAESSLLGGKPLVYTSVNRAPMDFTIDHASHTFRVKGSFSGTQRISDEDVELTVTIDLLGEFLNVSPVAVGKLESTKAVDCTRDMTNRKPVYLDSGGSFDIYDKLPSASAAYEWYEDYKLVTEKLWGKGKKVQIPAHQLGFGVHNITLVVRDSYGVAGTDTFGVDVRDISPPNLIAPPDRHVLSGGGPVKVNLGDPWFLDSCNGQVQLDNDAPADSMFPPGVTKVTWKADDGRGNVAKAVQTVNVYTMQHLQADKDIVQVLGPFWSSIEKSQAALGECEEDCMCEVPIGPLADAVGGLAEAVEKSSVQEARPMLRSLNAARAALAEAASLVEQSNSAARGKQTLRRAAIGRLEKARDLIQEAAGRSWQRDAESP
jgi:hypothetical protein